MPGRDCYPGYSVLGNMIINERNISAGGMGPGENLGQVSDTDAFMQHCQCHLILGGE